MDIVYVLGSGSAWSDNELRFSLRSLQKFVTGIDRVFVVGSYPKFLTNATFIPYIDRFPCKEKNIMMKLARACGHPELSDQFLHIHDDHFALAPTCACEVPNYAGGSLEHFKSKTVESRNNWFKACIRTFDHLKEKGLPGLNYDLHYPMIFDKRLYPEIMDRYNWHDRVGYVVKSLYANTAGLKPTRSGDLKINERLTTGQLVDRLKGRPWFSIGNGGLTGEFKALFQALYPEKSIFEKD